MNSDLYGAYSIVGGTGPDSGTIHVWCRLGGKHPTTMYRLLIPDYDLLTGDNLMFAEDWVDFLFGRNEIERLLAYLTRHDSFGDTHTFARAENLSLQHLRQHARKQHDGGGHELHANDDWHNPFEVFSVEVTRESRILTLN